MEHSKGRRLDFFLSYAPVDQAWAEWIAWTLEADGFQVMLQAWDSPAGSNWIQVMDAGIRGAARTIAVLSPDYLESVYGQVEWHAVLAQDVEATSQKLLPARVSDCTQPGLLAGMVSIDLFEIDEATARRRLQQMIEGAIAGRQKPKIAPAFPGNERPGRHPPFPGTPARDHPPNPEGREGTGQESAVSSMADGKPGNPANYTGIEDKAEGATVTDLSAYRLHGRDSTGAPGVTVLHDHIVKLSECAELVSASHSAGGSEYVWARLELSRLLVQTGPQLERVTQWLVRVRMTEDLATSSLRHSLRQYTSKNEVVVRALASLEPSQSSPRERGLVVEYEAAWRSLRDLLWRIHRELGVVLQPPGPTGLR
jgi:hypothetical protein